MLGSCAIWKRRFPVGEMEAVNSSNVSGIRYDEESRTLEIAFKRGATYQYTGVPPETVLALKAAPSIGQFINQKIKDVFPGGRI